MGDAASEAPEERLAFALSDGRVGVLSVSGRKVNRPSTFSCKIIVESRKVSKEFAMTFDAISIL